jgi:hypothetical protein
MLLIGSDDVVQAANQACCVVAQQSGLELWARSFCVLSSISGADYIRACAKSSA